MRPGSTAMPPNPMQDDAPATRRSFFQEHILDQPSSVKTVGYRYMSVAFFLFVAMFVWGWKTPLEIRGGTSFECAARVDKPPYAYWKNRRLIDVQVRVHDIKPACKNAVSVSKRMVFSLPARFAASPLLAKGQPLILESSATTRRTN